MNKMDIFYIVTSSIFVYGCLIFLAIAEFSDEDDPTNTTMLFAASMAASVLNIVFILRCRCQTGKTTKETDRA